MKKWNLVATSLIIIVIVFYGAWLVPNKIPYIDKLQIVSGTLFTLLLPLLVLCMIFSAWATKHLYVKIERVNIGGVNLFFDKPEAIFIRNTRAFLETKRTLYKIDSQLDNFNETLDSYFSTYQFVRQEMSILDPSKRKQKDLYDLSSQIIRELNLFLTTYQNNYRRWYKVTVDENQIGFVNEQGQHEIRKDIKPHLLSIGELQKYYYDYNAMLEGFKGINIFFKEVVNNQISVNISKWERE
ncbi:hypothetical protein [Priestia aryabhattai]|uniref:hypothetical protein n=1 Tax=Priestia aryabhattai TaxID=412384 RepID=UPI0030C91831